MNRRLITLLLFVGASLQTFLPEPAALGSNEWPILLGLTVCISLKSDRSCVLYAGLLAGLLHDAFSPAPLGISIPFFILIALGVYAIREEVFGDQIITYFVLGALGGLFKTLYFTLVFLATSLRPIGAGSLAIRLIGSILFGLFMTPLVFVLLSGLRPKRTPTQRWIAG